jgi:hypothetical protein
MGVPKPIVFRWITLMNFKCTYFHQYSDLQKFKHNSSIRKTIWNPMVILLMPIIEFLTEKKCFKVQNHRFSMEKWFCRAGTIEFNWLTLPLVGVPEGFLATLSINIFVNIGLIEII